MATKRQVSGWVVAVGVAGTVVLAMGAFSLSFTSLIHFAIRFGVDESQAWEWPLIVDGCIVVATVSVVALAGTRGARYAWAMLTGGALVSVASNAAQAWRLGTESPWIAAAVATVPPVVLLAATHMTVILTRPIDSDTTKGPTSPIEPAALPEPNTPGEPQHAPASNQTPSMANNEPPGSGHSRAGVVSRTSQREQACHLKELGWPIQQIAADLGVHPTTVSRWLKQANQEPDDADTTQGTATDEQGDDNDE